MRGKSRNTAEIAQETADLMLVLRSMPDNPVPWAAVVRMVTPFIARLAIRYALRRMGKNLSQDKINAISRAIKGIVEASTSPPESNEKVK